MRSSCVTLFLVLNSILSQAQVLRSKGVDFWMAFPQNTSGTGIELNIVSNVNTSGTITSPGGLSIAFTVTAGVKTIISTIPTTYILTLNQTVENKGIHISSLDTIVVNASTYAVGGGDASTILATPSLGTSYRTVGYHNLNPSTIQIVATADLTNVTITPTAATQGANAAGVPFVVSLSKGQSYQVRSTGDLSGTTVTSNFPIFVSTNSLCAQVPTGATYCDAIWETMIPINYWGMEFVTGQFTGRTQSGDFFKIIADQNSTAVRVNGVLVATLNAGQTYTTTLSGGNWIKSDRPICVLQFARSESVGGTPGDPFMVNLVPFNTFSNFYSFTTSSTSVISAHYITVMTKTANTALAKLDGVAIGGVWTACSTSGWSYRAVSVTNAYHTLSSDSLLNGLAYGWASITSYGYFVGADLPVVILPTKFKDIKGEHVPNKGNKIKWTTCKDEFCDQTTFIVERLNEAEWKMVQEVKSNGTESHEYLDASIDAGTTYSYRIGMVNNKEQCKYSESVSITTPVEEGINFAVTPNPFTNKVQLSLRLENEEEVCIKVINLLGETVLSERKIANAGSNNIELIESMIALSPGNYLLEVSTSTHIYHEKLIKQ